jgi:hypothetical protein
MKIVICASIDLTPKIKEIKDGLERLGHETEIPFMAKKILAGEISLAEFLAVKAAAGDGIFRERAGEDLIKRYYNMIKAADAIIIVNGDKKGIKNYIGGNVFLEMGFAYTMEKKIFLLNPIPEMGYSDEIKAMKPIILNNDLSKIN